MAETATPPTGHPTLGGKSLDNLPPNPYAAPERGQSYRSWRKKYRKMRAKFDGVLEENRRMFRDECKLEGLAKRLREELDGLLDICLDLNENPSLPPELRFNIRPPLRLPPVVEIPDSLTPEHADQMLLDYQQAVRQGTIPHLDLHIVRSEVEYKLAAQESRPLDNLLASLPSRPTADSISEDLLHPRDDPPPPGYLTADQETEYLTKLDTKLTDPLSAHRLSETAIPTHSKTPSKSTTTEEDKHFAEMTPRELERHVELLNPQSQHNWLKSHHKLGLLEDGANGETESLAAHDQGGNISSISKPSPSSLTTAPRKRGGGGTGKNLAKQVGDRALERAREEGGSPGISGYDGGGYGDEEMTVMGGEVPGSGKKKGSGSGGRDGDGAYNPKQGVKGSGNGGGSGGGGGGGKAKRKRSGGEELGGGSSASAGKKARVEGGGE
ncbi:hypothetical protein LTR78_001276 [Recurvomyces mirabilis]|uniref:IEC3 subunit of the Ino80 complex, chromatin re-modelling-domain-containing protein n=1 Tax=Recurvomyces mirabilis TaxID=574656 RepID=A0AAE1C5G4_9PEZI|nr:hypothetical protein LTR78_001276 [Recurvomyces mirabilis]KAK5161253.1 hypothetical protein LTS14_001049 [Recurvomyces mirabilis]